jgi:cellulose 1,4-beta-cellobiosidase
MTAIATIFQEVLTAAGGADKVRGFATDTANYTVLNETPELFDYQSNPCHDELTYVQKLTAQLATVGIQNKGFMIDTSRNGLGDIRYQWGSWCNVKGAGLGIRPTVNPATGIDAYYWVKPPGESDGTSDSTQPRFDPSCANQDATMGAPQAGTWFHSYFLNLVQNAAPPL